MRNRLANWPSWLSEGALKREGLPCIVEVTKPKQTGEQTRMDYIMLPSSLVGFTNDYTKIACYNPFLGGMATIF